MSASTSTRARRTCFTDPRPAAVTLTPESAEGPVGTTHTVTAAVEDANGPTWSQDVIVRFTVTGTVTDLGLLHDRRADGACDFTYPGPTVAGSDDITAFADTDGDGAQDFGEPDDSATKTWQAVDQDGDGVPDASDNCPLVANAGPGRHRRRWHRRRLRRVPDRPLERQ